MSQPDRVVIELSDDERGLLLCGLREWGGPATLTDAVAVAMGFVDRAEFWSERGRLASALEAGEALAPADWTRVLVATEIVFASDVLGSGVDWSSTTRFTDGESIAILRAVQRKARGRS